MCLLLNRTQLTTLGKWLETVEAICRMCMEFEPDTSQEVYPKQIGGNKKSEVVNQVVNLAYSRSPTYRCPPNKQLIPEHGLLSEVDSCINKRSSPKIPCMMYSKPIVVLQPK